MKKTAFLSVLALAAAICHAQSPAEWVDTTIGTEYNEWASGYNIPGASRPFGMVQFTTPIAGKEVGIVTNQLCTGGPHLGNFPILPVNGGIAASPGHMGDGKYYVNSEKGHAGYCELTVNENIKAELTATLRTGIGRFEFPEGCDKASFIIGAGISSGGASDGAIVVTGPRTVEGFSRDCKFCGWKHTSYTVYFAAEFDTDAIETGTWKEDRLMAGADFAEGKESGAYFTFKGGKKISYKFALSYVSVENAKMNLKAENPGWDFDAIRADAEGEWNRQLSCIDIKGATESRKIQFYTHLYHVFLAPTAWNDVNGEYMGSDLKIHTEKGRTVYSNFSNWDTYRTQIQLLSMVRPDVASDVIASHLDYAVQAGGGFPRWVLAGYETGVMQGDPTALLISNAYAFGARSFSMELAEKLMRLNADTPGLKCQNEEVRPYLKDYLEKGVAPASLLLEYTSADFAIGKFLSNARYDAFGAPTYFARADKWRNLFNPETGYIQCKDADGNWEPFSYDWGKYMEASYKAYFWMVPYNIAGLIDIIGGKDAANARLDELFRKIGASPFEDWFAPGNEPSFHIPWIYNWTGKPDKANLYLRRTLDELYYIGLKGVPGNDDMGTMGAWYVFTCLGMYPMIPGVGGFTLSTPLFEEATVHMPTGDLVIKGGSEKNIYTKSVSLSGKDIDTAWIDYEDWRGGAVIEYKTSAKPTAWGTTTTPPSFQ